MLLRVSASNFLSIAGRQDLSLIATKLKGREIQMFRIPGNSDLQVLPSAVMYGPNASGKSNFISAFRFMQAAVLKSHSSGSPTGGVPRLYFMLDGKAASRPTTLEADFVVGGTRVQYGFECDNDKFISEWLYSFPEGKRRKLFERNGQKIYFGQHFRGAKKILVDLMRPNSLFISTATQNDHEELTKIALFFKSIKFSSDVTVEKFLINKTFKKNQIDERTIKFLSSIGTGITGYRQKSVEISEELKFFTKEFHTLINKRLGNINIDEDSNVDQDKMVTIELSHSGIENEEFYFDLERESSGTRRLVLIMNSVFKAVDDGTIVVIDEIDASLHTHVAEQILNIFSDASINKNGAQIIATTHDTNLLNSKLLRRDQVWFCEKNEIGASEIYPLSDIKSRQTDNFEQGYLEGRYGAIPFSGNLESFYGDSYK